VEGMDKNCLKILATSLEPETSAIVPFFAEVVNKKSEFDKAELELANEGIDVLAQRMSDKINEHLKNGEEVASFFAVNKEGIVACKVTVGDDALGFKGIILTTDAVIAKEVMVTKDSAAIQGFISTADWAVAGQAVVTEDAVEYVVVAEAGEDGYYKVLLGAAGYA
jgi:hypothetical protein